MQLDPYTSTDLLIDKRAPSLSRGTLGRGKNATVGEYFLWPHAACQEARVYSTFMWTSVRIVEMQGCELKARHAAREIASGLVPHEKPTGIYVLIKATASCIIFAFFAHKLLSFSSP